jgi:hypothetical protein
MAELISMYTSITLNVDTLNVVTVSSVFDVGKITKLFVERNLTSCP